MPESKNSITNRCTLRRLVSDLGASGGFRSYFLAKGVIPCLFFCWPPRVFFCLCVFVSNFYFCVDFCGISIFVSISVYFLMILYIFVAISCLFVSIRVYSCSKYAACLFFRVSIFQNTMISNIKIAEIEIK